MTKPKKMSRAQIREALEQTPIDRVLMGSATASAGRLTAKQKQFAHEIALGETKANAYRKAYGSKGKPATVANKGYALARRDDIQAMVEAINRAQEAERLRTPAHLRALVIHQLTETAINPEVKDAQRLKALELLGKVTEVAAFTERRETISVKASVDMRDQLLESIRLAIKADATDADLLDGDDLLRELAQTDPTADAQGDPETPPTADPPQETEGPEPYIHTNPHNRPPEAHQPFATEPTDVEDVEANDDKVL